MPAEARPPDEQAVAGTPLLSPPRALAIFAVGIVALLGLGSLLLGQMSQTRSVGPVNDARAQVTAEAATPGVPTPATVAAAVAIRQATPAGAASAPEIVPLPAGGTPTGAVDGPVAPANAPGAASESVPLGAGGTATAAVAGQARASSAADTVSAGPGTTLASPTIAPAGAPPNEAGTSLALPKQANLGGALIPVGPDGVVAPGALSFAQSLAERVRTTAARPIASEPALDDVARRVLGDALAGAQERGYPEEDVVRRDGAIIRVEIVGVLPHSEAIALSALPKDVEAMGAAAGVAQRVEAGYFPDLVVVAAVSYR